MSKEAIIRKAVDKQFQMIGEKITYDDIKGGTVEVKGKAVAWYTLYQFKDEEQYQQWRQWVEGICGSDHFKLAEEIDLAWGMTYKIQKEKGQLDLF